MRRSAGARARPARLGLVALAIVACTPKAPPLTGTPAPARIPAAALPAVHQLIVFRWQYEDRSYRARGEGVARVSPPDSVRLDFFVDGGLGAGHAVLIDDDLRVPREARMVNDFLPPVPLLWAALGRLDIGAPPDTVARIAGDTLRIDAGRAPRWRSTFVRDTLTGLALIDGDRLRQQVTRHATREVRFRNLGARRDLRLTITRVDTVPSGFDAAIWR